MINITPTTTENPCINMFLTLGGNFRNRLYTHKKISMLDFSCGFLYGLTYAKFYNFSIFTKTIHYIKWCYDQKSFLPKKILISFVDSTILTVVGCAIGRLAEQYFWDP